MPSCTLELKIIPGAPRDEITGRIGGAIKIKLRAPALEGRANEALVEFLADRLGVPRHAVSLLRGEKSRQKAVRVEGLTEDKVHRLLGA